MRKLILALAGVTTIGWAVSRLFQGNGERPASASPEMARERHTSRRAAKRRMGPTPASGPDSSYNVALQRPQADVVLADSAEEDVASEPANVVDLGAFRRRHHPEKATGRAPAGPGRQTEKARMKRARDAVDERFRKLPKKGDGGDRAVA